MTDKVVRPHPEGMFPPVPEGTVFREITSEEAEHIFTPLSPADEALVRLAMDNLDALNAWLLSQDPPDPIPALEPPL